MLFGRVALSLAVIGLAGTITGSAAHAAQGTVIRSQARSLGHGVIARPAAPATVNWDQIGFDATHAGYNAHEATLNASNVSQLQQAWSFPAGTGNVVGDVVEDGGIVYAATSSGVLFAIDAATGSQVWSFAAGTGYATSGSAAAVDKGTAFTTCNTASGYQGICALNAATGAVIWVHAPKGATTFGETAPAVANGLVYVGECAAECAWVALKEKTGKLVWSTPEAGQECTLNGGSPLAVQGGSVFADAGCGAPVALALDANTGSQLWLNGLGTFGSPQGISVSGAVVGVMVYGQNVSSPSEWMFVVSSQSGQVNWVLPSSGPLTGRRPSFAYRLIYAPTDGSLTACKYKPTEHGHLRCAFKVVGVSQGVAIANHLLFLVAEGEVEAWAASDGALIWQSGVNTGGGAPIVVNGTVIGSCDTSSICAWGLPATLRRK